jgi:excisionase family DNA binding protein
MPKRFTKKETAELLRISVRQVQRLMAAGKLSYQMGHTPRGDVVLFDRQELERFAEARRFPMDEYVEFETTNALLRDVHISLGRMIELLEIIAREIEGLGDNFATIQHGLNCIRDHMVDEDHVSDIRDDLANIQLELEMRRHADKVLPP